MRRLILFIIIVSAFDEYALRSETESTVLRCNCYTQVMLFDVVLLLGTRFPAKLNNPSPPSVSLVSTVNWR